MATTLFDLIQVPTQDDFVRQRVSLLAVQGFPITAWEPGGVARALIETEAAIDADQARLVPVLCASAFLGTAAGDWLDLKGESDYDEARKPAVATVGQLRVADVAHVGPATIAAGDLVAIGPDGQEYVSTASVTVPLDGQASVAIAARQLGSQGNVGVNTITVFGIDHPGLAISNVDIGGGVWITTLGADAESDQDYAERCRLKWSALGSGSNADAYQYFALQSSNGIRRARVLEHVPQDGQVTVQVAGSTAPATDDAVSLCAAAIEAERPMGVRVYVVNSAAYQVVIAGVVKVKSAFLTTAPAAVSANLLAYLARLGLSDALLFSQAVEEIMSPSGVVDVRLSSPTDDVTPPDGSCLTIQNNLTYVGVLSAE